MSEYAEELTALVRSMAGADPGADRWAAVQELGLVGIGTPEQAGGSGGSLGDLLVVIAELADAGIACPIVAASTALYAVGPAAGLDAVAFIDTDLHTPVTSELGVVPYAGSATRIVLIGSGTVGTVDTSAPGVELTAGVDMAGADAARVRLRAAPVLLHDQGPGAQAVTTRLALARAAELIGSAGAAYRITRTYVAEREQFGAPLIAIPAVAAALAQMAVRLRGAQSAVDRAVEVFDDAASGAQRRVVAAAGARMLAADTATQIARAAHQLHGAVGITGEYGLHRFTRRLWAARDADRSEQQWGALVGAAVRSGDESAFWDELTA